MYAERCYVSVRLQYFDDVTPVDYQPPGFRDASDDPDVSFSSKTQAFKVGQVETPYHGYVCSRLQSFSMLTDSSVCAPFQTRGEKTCQSHLHTYAVIL